MDQIAALIFTTVLFGLSLFQVALALGKPWGEYAWGGQHKVLPKNFRIGSLISISVYAFFVSIVLDRSGVIDIYKSGFMNESPIWIIVVYSVLGIFMNATSRSRKERMTMTPLVAILFICSLVVAI